jgi:hypothetical protein
MSVGCNTVEALKPLKQLIHFGPGSRTSVWKKAQAAFLTDLGLRIGSGAVYNADDWATETAYVLTHRLHAVRLLNTLNSLHTKLAGDRRFDASYYSEDNPYHIWL